MIYPITSWPLATWFAFYLIGLVLGTFYFHSIRMTADLVVSSGHPLLALSLTLARVGLLGTGLYLAVLFGGLPLISALVGVLGARAFVLRLPKESSL